MLAYIQDSKDMGMAALDPWHAHLTVAYAEDETLRANADSTTEQFSADVLTYFEQVKQAAAAAELPIACLAIDRSHMYEPTAEARAVNRACAYRWIDAAQRIGAKQVRLDSGGSETMTNEMFEIIVEGYHDVMKRTQDAGLELIMENHWGSNCVPENVIKILEAVDGLGLLFDTNNWAEGTQKQGWELCAPHARSVHVKTFEFDENGDDPTVDLEYVIKLLVQHGYDDIWGIESVPKDGDERGAVEKTKALITRILGS